MLRGSILLCGGSNLPKVELREEISLPETTPDESDQKPRGAEEGMNWQTVAMSRYIVGPHSLVVRVT